LVTGAEVAQKIVATTTDAGAVIGSGKTNPKRRIGG
jgi:hypothetical protein